MSAAPHRALPERPMPTPTRESQPYWDGMREGRFMLQHCASLRRRCGTIRGRSARTASRWRASSRKRRLGGTIHAWTVCHHPFNFFFKAQAPYIVALVDMDAGVRVNAPLRGIDAAGLKIGQKVRLQFEPVSKEVTLPFFVAA